ncbi:MAG: phosphatidylserine decarboxylase [Pseudomonadota bacterium]
MIWLLVVFLAFVAAFGFWRFWYFLRDPKREPPEGEDLILAAADGYITYVKRVEAGEIPIALKNRTHIRLDEFTALPEMAGGAGYLIGTYMTETSVHRNRAPVSGEVILRRHRPAAETNRSLARMTANLTLGRQPFEAGCDFLLENERLTIALRMADGPVVTVTQIADQWIDRIVARVAVGDQLERGAQYGMIRFGSQCDVYLPEAVVAEIRVAPGDYVYAGESVLAHRAG